MSAAPAKLALVTGGCRRLGAAISAGLAAEGFALALHAHDEAKPDPELAAAIEAAGVGWAPFPADLADAEAVAALVPRVASHFGRVPDLLVNNASRFDWDAPESVSAACMVGHYAVNAAAPAVLTRAIAEGAGAERPATVVNILDQRIAQPNADQLSYTLSKLALAEMTEILARHFAPRVRIVAVAPGLTLPTEDYDEAQLARMTEAMPLGRLPTPADIVAAIRYLIGAPAVTGQTIFVDGGAHLCRFARDFVFMKRDGAAV